ncbi:hypothetical protein JCM11641_004160 [Rhodosporidiobolus odoratus]
MEHAPAPSALNPRHMGLPRRQSFDPLSSTKKALTLGQLPPPSFGVMPSGLRSVPALESARPFGSNAFRHVAAPLGDGQRTPGGSLVIGAEVFGFGKYAPKERRGNGSADGDDGRTSKIGSDWPSEFSSRATASTDDLQRDPGTKRTFDRLSGDFSSAGLPRPRHQTTGSSIDLRPSSPASGMPDSLRAPSRSSLLPSSNLASHSSGESSHDHSPLASSGVLSDPNTATTGGLSSGGPSPYGDLGDATPSPSAGPYLYPFQPPDPSPPPLGNPYFAQGFALPMSPPLLPRTGRPGEQLYGNGFGQHDGVTSPDDLALGMGNMSLGSNGGMGGNGGANQGRGGQVPHRAMFSPEPYAGGGISRNQPSRQSAGGFQPYFMASPGSPYMAGQDAYSPMNFGTSNAFYSPGAVPDGVNGRRDSVQPPGWGLSMPPFALPAELQQTPSSVPSRQGSFSYTPTGLPQTNGFSHYAPGTPSGYAPASHSEQVAPMYANGPQLGQQHQIILGRAVRGVEYIAPGPVPAHGYGAGYGPDMRSLRSPLLEEFRSNRNRSWELPDLIGHIVEFAGDQLGSRHIQTKLDTATTDEKNMVFQEILPNMLQLSTDVFANYVIQKFFEQGSQVQKTAMAKVLEGHVLQLSLQMYGCRVVQKALEYVLVDQQVRLVNELDGHVLKCARDAQSNHVVQRALERVPPEHLHFVTDACLGQVHALATHPYGCRVLQRIFENCPPSQSRALLDELHRYTQNLIQDQYGNYVVQWVIEKGEQSDRSLVIAEIYGQILPLAQQKFASNVVEKCVIHGTEEERQRIVDEILQPGHDGSSIVKAMVVHPFANYVVQKCLQCTAGPQREALFAEATTQLISLRKYSTTYSKHLITIQKAIVAERERLNLPPLDFGDRPGFGIDGHHPQPPPMSYY